MGAAASVSFTEIPANPSTYVRWLGSLTTGQRQIVAGLPPWGIQRASVAADQARATLNTRVFSLPKKWPCSCDLCPGAVETYCTEADYRYHFVSEHKNCFRGAVLTENELPRDARPAIPLALRALSYFGPSELLDFSSCSTLCFLVCESALLFPPYGKAAYSTINKTAVLSERACALAHVTGNVLRSSNRRLKRARKQLTGLVRGHRVNFMKESKLASQSQVRMAAALLALIDSDSHGSQHDPCRRVCDMITSEDRTAGVPTIEKHLLSLDHISVSPQTMQVFERSIKGVRNDLLLASHKSDAERTSTSHRGMDKWTLAIAQFIVAFSEYYYSADFAVAAGSHLVQTVDARNRAYTIKQRICANFPLWFEECSKMQNSLERRERHLRHVTKEAREKMKQRVESLSRLAARGYPEHLGHWNVHALLTAHSGDWEAVLKKLSAEADDTVSPEVEDFSH